MSQYSKCSIVVVPECNDGVPRLGVCDSRNPPRVWLANPEKFISGEEKFCSVDLPLDARLPVSDDLERLFPELRKQPIKMLEFWRELLRDCC